jgi:hypothetical protein
VLMPGYRKILNDKYGRDNVHLRAHGILTRRPEFPDFSRRGNPIHRILAFGKWGTYKRLEPMIEAFNLLVEKMPEARLVIGGGDHPQAPGYIDSVRKQCAGDERIEFRGYVPEDELADIFQSSTVAVMPYSSSTGCSGVAHLACAYGVPIVCADIADFRQMAQAEELAIEFYPAAGNAQGLAECLFNFLQDTPKQQQMAVQNFSAGLRMTMPNVVQKYLRHFELQQRVQTLRYVSRFRRLPRWIPSKSLLLRLMTRNSLGWARRSAIMHSPWNGRAEPGSVNGDGNRRSGVDGSGFAINGKNIGVDGRAGINGFEAVTSARSLRYQGGEDGNGSQRHQQVSASDGAHDGYSKQTEAEQSSSEKEVPTLSPVRSRRSAGFEAESGIDGAGPGNNGRRGERTA